MKVVDARQGLLVLAVVSLCDAAEGSTSTVYHYITTTAIATLHREYCSCDAISTQRVSAPTPTTGTMGPVTHGGTSILGYSTGLKSVLESSSMTKSTGPLETYTSEVDSLTATTTASSRSPEQATTSTITGTMSTDVLISHSVAAATSQIKGGPQQAGASSSAAPYVTTTSSRTSGTSHVTSSGSVVDLPQSQTSTSQSSSLVSELTSSARSDTTFTSSQGSPAKTSETQCTTASQDLDVSVSSFVVPRTSTSTSQSSPRSSAQHSSFPPGVSTSASLHTSVASSVIGRTSPVSTSVGDVASIQHPTAATQQPTSMLSEVSSTSAPEKGTPLPSSLTSSTSVTRSTMGSSSAAQSAVVSNVDWPRSFPFLRTSAVVTLASLTTASLSPTSITRPLPFPKPSVVGRPVNLFWQPISVAVWVNELMSIDYTTHAFTRETNYFYHKIRKHDMTTTPRFVFYLSIEDKTITTDRGNLIGYDKSKIATGARLYYDDVNKTLTTNEFIITNGSVGTISVPDCTIFRNWYGDHGTFGIILTKNLRKVRLDPRVLWKSKIRFLNLPDWPAMEVPP